MNLKTLIHLTQRREDAKKSNSRQTVALHQPGASAVLSIHLFFFVNFVALREQLHFQVKGDGGSGGSFHESGTARLIEPKPHWSVRHA
ncbi:hypothetical protein Ppro_2353 [Pelobacter propionicus DSM 2379]|uniref:Uncharacterized protein n=1 Tax=Pelobacter propionicus (strain DSM 2379 / NBRC 103807 / OttBd1) TaxID=338966 RepID=A1ARJ0_PELPD|nr:hypothetical protein Ppro_2353 [Pelobacter propionicus DSM 2379]